LRRTLAFALSIQAIIDLLLFAMKRLNLRLYLLLSVLACLGLADRTLAQIVEQTAGPGITGTGVSPGPNISITGGQRFGPNLFHSFEQFNLSDGQTATFATQGANSVLARVIGGSPSVIDGILKTSSSASLYLMNPTGILFGKNAIVDVQGSFVATTAHGIGFDSNLWFNATGPNDYANLTTSNPQVLGFNSSSGPIVNSGQIIASGNGFGGPAQLALVGSTVVNTGNLKARGEGIAIATVSGAKTVRLGIGSNILTLEVAPPTAIMPTAWTLPLVALPALTTGGNSPLVTNLVNNPDGSVSLLSQPTKAILPGDIATTQLAQGLSADNPGAINLQAQNNLTLTGDITLQAEDSGSAPSGLLLNSGGDLQAANLNIAYALFSKVRDERATVVAQGKVNIASIQQFPLATVTGSEVTLGDVTLADRADQVQGNPGLTQPILTATSTTGVLTIGEVAAPGGGVTLTAQGDLTTGRINTFPSDFAAGSSPIPDGGIRLTSQAGNVLSRSLRTGTASIQVKTPGTFRVYGTASSDIDSAIQTIYLSLNNNPDLVNYLVSLGIPLAKLQSASATGTAYVPVVYFAKGNIVSYGDPADKGKIPAAQTLEQNIGVKPFYTGGLSPAYSINSGNPLTDFNPNLNQGPDPNPNNTQTFKLERSYVPLNDFPAGISGSPIGIVRLEGTNAALVGSTTSRPFIPAPPAPIPDPIANPIPIATPIAPPSTTPPENSPSSTSQTTVVSSTALDRQQNPTPPCIKSKQSPSTNCSPEEKSEAAILKILER
jgi:filamentous hemagglutinin family protein